MGGNSTAIDIKKCIFPKEVIRNTIKEDLEFLIGFDKEVHTMKKGSFVTKSGIYGLGVIDEFIDIKIDIQKFERFLGIIENNNFVFYPINTCMGFTVGFEICDKKKKRILTFIERQLPQEYDFDKLAKYFMNKTNIKMAKKLGIEIINDRNHYDY